MAFTSIVPNFSSSLFVVRSFDTRSIESTIWNQDPNNSENYPPSGFVVDVAVGRRAEEECERITLLISNTRIPIYLLAGAPTNLHLPNILVIWPWCCPRSECFEMTIDKSTTGVTGRLLENPTRDGWQHSMTASQWLYHLWWWWLGVEGTGRRCTLVGGALPGPIE